MTSECLMTVPLIYLNGRFLPQTEAALPLHDAGFVMGATVTDFCRTFKRVLFRWDDHLKRFRRDCEACFIPLAKTDKQLTAIAKKLIAHNRRLISPDQELALISFATPGPIGYYLGEPGGAGDGPPTLGMHTFPLPFERYRRFFTEGVALATPRPHDTTTAGGFARNKHRSRLHWWAAERRLREEGRPPGTVALCQSAQGDLTETAIGHLLLVQQGTVVTPRRKFVLDGISLRVVAELCSDLNIPHADTDLSLIAAQKADEVMLCGTAFCLAAVSRINDTSIPWPGPVFARLLKAWSERVGLDIARQFLPKP